MIRVFFSFQGKLVYAHQGKASDYEKLNKTVDLRGTIAITRYGGAGRAAKVRLFPGKSSESSLQNRKNFAVNDEMLDIGLYKKTD